ncbi:hypothetical protein EI74_0235 [Mycoplasma testudineum]|uniref:Uncharacterized protein n=1 Tax=Mycoplasma testudineum TaxID=244584 RepID=A0A4R6IGK1_9MOLU|nr:hypothetical protein [Mycoplasma testudineum]OYD27041.1 hypothetical protein CG473_00100 [Mycoplasma testudineum]TDO21204.1 hypothetical protein EI74_0235 [Mycoplasma testudineum]
MLNKKTVILLTAGLGVFVVGAGAASGIIVSTRNNKNVTIEPVQAVQNTDSSEFVEQIKNFDFNRTESAQSIFSKGKMSADQVSKYIDTKKLKDDEKLEIEVTELSDEKAVMNVYVLKNETVQSQSEITISDFNKTLFSYNSNTNVEVVTPNTFEEEIKNFTTKLTSRSFPVNPKIQTSVFEKQFNSKSNADKVTYVYSFNDELRTLLNSRPEYRVSKLEITDWDKLVVDLKVTMTSSDKSWEINFRLADFAQENASSNNSTSPEIDTALIELETIKKSYMSEYKNLNASLDLNAFSSGLTKDNLISKLESNFQNFEFLGKDYLVDFTTEVSNLQNKVNIKLKLQSKNETVIISFNLVNFVVIDSKSVEQFEALEKLVKSKNNSLIISVNKTAEDFYESFLKGNSVKAQEDYLKANLDKSSLTVFNELIKKELNFAFQSNIVLNKANNDSSSGYLELQLSALINNKIRHINVQIVGFLSKVEYQAFLNKVAQEEFQKALQKEIEQKAKQEKLELEKVNALITKLQNTKSLEISASQSLKQLYDELRVLPFSEAILKIRNFVKLSEFSEINNYVAIESVIFNFNTKAIIGQNPLTATIKVAHKSRKFTLVFELKKQDELLNYNGTTIEMNSTYPLTLIRKYFAASANDAKEKLQPVLDELKNSNLQVVEFIRKTSFKSVVLNPLANSKHSFNLELIDQNNIKYFFIMKMQPYKVNLSEAFYIEEMTVKLHLAARTRQWLSNYNWQRVAEVIWFQRLVYPHIKDSFQPVIDKNKINNRDVNQKFSINQELYNFLTSNKVAVMRYFSVGSDNQIGVTIVFDAIDENGNRVDSYNVVNFIVPYIQIWEPHTRYWRTW